MIYPNPNTAPDDRELDAVSLQLRSKKPGDIWHGIEQVTHWLQENPDTPKIYEMLLNIVKDNRTLREKVRNLLLEMKRRGSKSAESALHSLPSNVQDFLSDADDAYYAAEYEEAIKAYMQVLRLDPENLRAKDQLAKAEIKRMESEADTGLPRAAEQYYRQARSFIAARDVPTAMKLLGAAIEAAQAKGMKYPEAEEALTNMQNLIIADDFKRRANLALEKKLWKDAIDLYNQALTLDPTNIIIKKELECLQGLLQAESELRKKGILKLFTPLGHVKKALKSARGVMSPDNPLLNFVENQLNKIRLIQIEGIITLFIGAVVFLFIGGKPDLDDFLATSTPTNVPTILSAPTKAPTPSASETSTIISPVTPTTSINALTVTSTYTLAPTPTTTLGYGKLIAPFFPLQTLNGKRVQHLINGKMSDLQLDRKQFITIVDSKNDHGYIWYKCIWKINGIPGEGWILGDAIQFVPPPSPTP